MVLPKSVPFIHQRYFYRNMKPRETNNLNGICLMSWYINVSCHVSNSCIWHFSYYKISRDITCIITSFLTSERYFVILKAIESLKLIFLPFNIFHRRGWSCGTERNYFRGVKLFVILHNESRIISKYASGNRYVNEIWMTSMKDNL